MRTQTVDKEQQKKLIDEERVRNAKKALKKINSEKFQAEAAALDFDAHKLYFAREKVAKIKKNYRKEQSLRTQVCNQEILHAFLEKEAPGQNGLAEYLENCDVLTKKRDLDTALKALKRGIDPENKGVPNDTDLGKYYTYMQQNKDTIPAEKLPHITAITSRAVFKIKMPKHDNNKPQGINIFRGQQNVKEIYSYTWGKIIGGFFLSIFFGAGIPFIIQGWKEKKFKDYANGLFKPATQVNNLNITSMEESENMLEHKSVYELVEQHLLTENKPPYHRKVSIHLSRQTTQDEQNREMKEALGSLNDGIQKLPEDHFFVKIYAQLDQLSKTVPAVKRPALTENVIRVLFLVKHPEDANNAFDGISNTRSKFLANEIAPPVRRMFSSKEKKSELCNLIEQAFKAQPELASKRILRGSVNTF